MLDSDTIAAIATAPGVGAIAIVRMSGRQAFDIAEKIFARRWQSASGVGLPERASARYTKGPDQSGGSSGDRPADANTGASSHGSPFVSHKALHGYVRDDGKNVVDEVVVIPYRRPHSYTGEDLVEINCHGGVVVVREILNLCLRLGARLARPGEFTERAFINGRLDLTQAEAVLDLIQAKTSRQSRMALSALHGELGEKINLVRTELMDLMARITAGIDFPEEVGEIELNDVSEIVARSSDRLEGLSKTARSGRFLRDGLRLAIVGKPNAGKSSLLNQLVKFERAIVTDIPGTTRDSLEEILDLNGIPVILVDTAGIRLTDDTVEKIGIDRTRKIINEADLVVFLTDLETGWTEADDEVLRLVRVKTYMLILNKVDLVTGFELERADLPESDENRLACLTLSAKTGEGLETLADQIEAWVFGDGAARETGGSLNQRQEELCEKAIQSLKLVQETVDNEMPQDCLATDLKLAIDALSEISGQSVSEEVITGVFAKFCIGK